jgi:hypothetical protein
MAPAKKRSRSIIPILLGAFVVLGGGAAAAKMLMFGPKADGSAVRPDTAQRGATGDPQRAGTTGNHKTAGGSPAHVVPPNGRDSTHRTGAPAGPTVDVAKAGAALDALQDVADRDPSRARDSAMVFYNAPGVASVDKATAAFVIATTYWNQHDRQRGCDWIGRARTLDPGTPTYATVSTQQCRN